MTNERHRSWSQAWRDSQSGEGGFYRTHRAEEEFATSVHIGSQLATHLAQRLERIRDQQPDADLTFIDVGAGDGSLTEQVHRLAPHDVRCIGVDLRTRPASLDNDITWISREITSTIDDITGRDGQWAGVLVAHEFLDDIPCDVLELDEHHVPRVVLVDPADGAEEIGPAIGDPAATRYLQFPEHTGEWLQRWWPATRPLARREMGLSRDLVWARLRRVISFGEAIAIDYAHSFDERRSGAWDAGTVKGFARGRPRRPVPDGSVNITAHVALDSCAGPDAELLYQWDVLDGLAGSATGVGSYRWLIEHVAPR